MNDERWQGRRRVVRGGAGGRVVGGRGEGNALYIRGAMGGEEKDVDGGDGGGDGRGRGRGEEGVNCTEAIGGGQESESRLQ
jgi:hypothetical protein